MIWLIVRAVSPCPRPEPLPFLKIPGKGFGPQDAQALTSSSDSDGHMPINVCVNSYLSFVSTAGTSKTRFTQHFAQVWPWLYVYLCHLAERCRSAVACAPCLALMTLQEGMPGQTKSLHQSPRNQVFSLHKARGPLQVLRREKASCICM